MGNELSQKKKRFCVKKYVHASCAEEALKLAKTVPVQDVYVDEEEHKAPSASALGFHTVYPFED